MNLRIKELYEQAHIERRQEYFSSVVDPTIKSVSVTRHFNPDLFAELIVRECIQSIQSDMDRETMNGTISLAKHAGMVSAKTVIKKHFGVEE